MEMNRYQKLLHATEAQVGTIKIIRHEDSWFISVIHWFLKLITRKDSYSSFTTTIGRRMYVPDTFNHWHPRFQYALLRHERVHMLQFRQWPFKFLDLPILWYINACIFGFCYLFLLPALWNPFRTHFERDGYRETLRAKIEVGIINVESEKERAYWLDRMIRTFTGPAYAWMAWGRKKYVTEFVTEIFEEALEEKKRNGEIKRTA